MGAAEVAARLGLNKSTAHRLLTILQERRFLERSAITGKYRLGWRLYELGSLAASRVDLYEVARPYIEQLVKDTGETAHLGVLRGDEIISLVNVESSRTVRTPSTVGRRNPTYCTSLGKAILANLPEAVSSRLIDKIQFKPFTKHTCINAARLRRELKVVRERGYAIDNEEIEEGLRCVGAPVWNHDEQVVAGVSIAGPSYRVGGEHLSGLVDMVVTGARKLSCALGSRKNA
jgi:DNA-binding IclR family transcriptional regulator